MVIIYLRISSIIFISHIQSTLIIKIIGIQNKGDIVRGNQLKVDQSSL